MGTQQFTAKLEQWGRVYGVDVPTDVSVALGIGGHVAVVGKVGGKAFRGTLTPMGGARHRLLLNAETRKVARGRVGALLEFLIQQDPSNRVPPVPDDFAEALDVLTLAKERFDHWPPSHQREILLWIAEAQKPETRARRIARAMARVMEDA